MPSLRMLLAHGLERHDVFRVRAKRANPAAARVTAVPAGPDIHRAAAKYAASEEAVNRQKTQTMPSSSAFNTARVRSRTPSLERMLDTWFFTVPSATFSELAISLLL